MSEITVKATLDLEGVWEEINDKAFVDELHIRAAHDLIREAIDGYAPDEPLFIERDEDDPWFQPLSDWDRAELVKAIREDDGKRAIDLLKRHVA
jgi:hypothetical protein